MTMWSKLAPLQSTKTLMLQFKKKEKKKKEKDVLEFVIITH